MVPDDLQVKTIMHLRLPLLREPFFAWIYCRWLFFVAKNKKNSPNPLTKKGKMGRIKPIRKFFRERRGMDYGSADFGCVGGAFGAFVGSGAGLCSCAGGGQRLPDPGALAECAGYGIPGGWCYGLLPNLCRHGQSLSVFCGEYARSAGGTGGEYRRRCPEFAGVLCQILH